MGGGLLNSGSQDGSQQQIPQPSYVDPRLLAIIGGLKAASDANPPQAASRLPLAHPSTLYTMGQALGGYGQGLLAGQKATEGNLQNFQAQQQIQMFQDYLQGKGIFQRGGQQQPQGGPQQSLDAGPAAMASSLLAGGRSGPTPQAASLLNPAPQQGQPPTPSSGGLLSGEGALDPNTMMGARIANMIGGQTGGDIYKSQFPGPTDATRSLRAAGIDPNSPQGRSLLATAASKASGIEPTINLRQGGSAWQYNPQTQKYELGAQNPVLGPGIALKTDAQGNPEAYGVPGHIPAMAAVDTAKTTAEEQAKAAVNLGSLYRPPGTPPAAGGVGPTPPNQAAAKGAVPTPGLNQPITTPRGTQIPPITDAAPISDAPAYLEKRLPQWAETENEWSKALPSNYVAEQRGLAIADALKKTQSGSWATEEATVAASLHAVGIDLPPEVLGDPAQVQRALKDNFAQTLATIRQFSSRPAASELILGQKNYSNPNLQPEANLSILSETVGQMRWERALMQDYTQAKRMGWKDPQDFQQAWTQLNPIQKFIDQTKSEIGPLKGMAQGPADLPKGSVQLPGTYGGKKAYQLPDGSKVMEQ